MWSDDVAWAAGNRVQVAAKSQYYTEGAGAAQAGVGRPWVRDRQGGNARIRERAARAHPGRVHAPRECRGRESNPHAPKDSGF